MALVTAASTDIDLRSDTEPSWPLPDPETIERRIAEYEAQISLLRGELDVIAAAYRRVTTTWLVAWYEDEAKRAITADPAFTDAVSDEQLAVMRAEVLEVIGEAAATVDALLADEVWPHHATYDEILAEPRECTRLPAAIDLGHRRAMGRLGRILASHGFGRAAAAALSSGLCAYDWTVDGDQVEYPFAITISDDAKAAFGEYCRTWSMLHATVAEIATFELARNRSAVIDRWESLDT